MDWKALEQLFVSAEVRTFISVLSASLLLYGILVLRRIYRRLVWLEHLQQSSDYALVKVLNGKGKEYLEVRKEQVESFMRQESFLNMPPMWKIKQAAIAMLKVFKPM